MFGPNTITKSFSLIKVINGLSRGLNIANQVIPLYQQAKPMLNNARKIISIINETTPKNKNVKTIDIKVNKKNTKFNHSNPVFFQ